MKSPFFIFYREALTRLFHNFFLHIYCVSGTIVDLGGGVMNKTDRVFDFLELPF